MNREYAIDVAASVLVAVATWLMVMAFGGPVWAAWGFSYGIFLIDRARSDIGRRA